MRQAHYGKLGDPHSIGWCEGGETQGRGYPAHLEPGNLFCHHWRGRTQVGRSTTCLVCNVSSNTRNRNGDARFIRAHRRCGLLR